MEYVGEGEVEYVWQGLREVCSGVCRGGFKGGV